MGRTATIQLTIQGKGVTPQTLPLDDLWACVHRYRDAVLAHAGEDGLLDDREVISLIGVEGGSARPVLRAPNRIKAHAHALALSLNDPSACKQPTPAQRIVAEISKRCAARGLSMGLPCGRGQFVKIGADRPFEVPPPPVYVESATVYGKIRNVGGAVPHAEVVLDDLRTISVQGDEALIVELAQSLYQTVGLEGEATYDAETQQLKSFRAIRRTEFVEGDLLAAFEELAAVSKGVWDGIDAVEYIQRLRADE